MISKSNYRKIGIVGFGREGKAVLDYFSTNSNVEGELEFYIFDKVDLSIDKSQMSSAKILDIKTFSGTDYKTKILEEQNNLDIIFRSPGVPLWDIESQLNKSKVNTITNYFFERCKELEVKIIGVTGTKGKGTTSTLIYEILKADGKDVYLVGNIGSPALSIINELEVKKRSGFKSIVVYEMSSFQLYDIKHSPNIAVCLLVTEDHLDWHKDVEHYRRAKENIFKYQSVDDVAIYYTDNKYSSEFASSSQALKKISYGESVEAHVGVREGCYEFNGNKIILESEVKLPGKHNRQNIMAAVAATYDLVDNKEIISKVLKEFAGLKYHIETVGIKNGIKFVNDSFSVNPTSSSVAIDSFSEKIVLLLGGVDRGLNLENFAKKLHDSKNLKKIILYGKFGERLSDLLTKSNTQNTILLNDKTFEEIFETAISLVQAGEVVLFSPGAPSFDMFENYIKRGEKFDQLVKEL